ncbi:nitroreductase family protein [Nonomuraea sp. 3-1Str]|uniref:nitroreductase family protein n=1 Tax=unclassified Nonomuraea TaxID=2593643 RepID=UPI002855FACF|nr:nitroreductase family protein [Nonomuraea sp. 3-1Str]MDR8412909.1 nitroreductase family protein [Nonomuraea sp. 3-1Str]
MNGPPASAALPGHLTGLPFDVAETDRLLTTTRSVRRRLDVERPVPREVVQEALEVAVQAPTANNHQNWRWLVISDAAVKQELAGMIQSSWTFHRNDMWTNAGRRRNDAQARRNYASAQALTETIAAVPILVIPCVLGRPPDITAINEAWRRRMSDKVAEDPGHQVQHGETRASIFYGSIFPAIWSFQLALRSRGLGSTITCLHVPHERQVARMLGIPSGVTQVCMIPVAYTVGTDFRPAERYSAKERTYWERWGM